MRLHSPAGPLFSGWIRFGRFVAMQRFGIVLIVAVLTLGLGGCKVDPASKESSALDARASDLPKADAADPSAPAVSVAPVSGTKSGGRSSKPVIVCFGDSLTAGYGAEAGQSYPDFLQEDLDAKGYRYRVVNAGINGNTTKDGVERLGSIVAMKPEVVVVEFGGNDGLRGLRIEDSRSNLDKIISTLQASGAKVVLAGITLPPDYGQDYIKQFNATYALLAKKYNVPVIPFLLKDVFGIPGMMQADNTHATAKGNEQVARNVLPLVVPYLKK
jgi:acyl-CoA thioesterase-1